SGAARFGRSRVQGKGQRLWTVKLDVPKTLEQVARTSPQALVFGTDIPSTRAERPFMPSDVDLVGNVLGAELARKAFWDNPLALYRVTQTAPS
ncbi:MAG: hypothetical protein WAK85_00930, partial [Xanthobacteraceae bacterium]